MIAFVKSLFFPKSKLPDKQKRDPDRYEKEKIKASSDNLSDRLTLARNTKTHQEILYYLAETDPDDKVRKAVAENPSTPLQAGKSLSMDKNPDVRMALAKRLVSLLPGLDEEKHSQIYAYTVQALGALALDEVLKIRIALSSSLKDIAQTPPKVANTLARDIERDVAEPILQFCAALSDEDLIDILSGHPESWAAQAIAYRSSISDPVSNAVIHTDDIKAGKILMENEGAEMTDALLEKIVDKARDIPEWQAPLARRPSLPPELACELANFAQESVRAILTARKDFDPETAFEIEEVFQRRLSLANIQTDTSLSIEDRVQDLLDRGYLNEQTLLDYLGIRDKKMTMAILARMAQTSYENVEKIMSLKAAKPVIALSWKAGISMRAAFQLEKDLAHIEPKSLIYPKEGTEYPLVEDEIEWQLEFLGLKAA